MKMIKAMFRNNQLRLFSMLFTIMNYDYENHNETHFDLTFRWENIIRSLTGKRWRPNRQFNMSIAILTAGCIFYTFILVFGNWLGDIDMSAVYSICMNTNQASRTYLLGIGIGVPGMISILVTMGIDWKCYKTVKIFRHGQNEANKTKSTVRTHKNADFLRFLGQEAPMRSTIINVVCIILSVTISSLVVCMEENLQDDMDKVLIPIGNSQLNSLLYNFTNVFFLYFTQLSSIP